MSITRQQVLREKSATTSASNPDKSPAVKSSASDKKTSLSDQLRDIETSLVNKFKSLLAEFECNFNQKLSEAIASLDSKVQQFESSLSDLRDENRKLREELADIQRKERLCDVIVRGIPRTPNENPIEVVRGIAAKLCHQISPHFDAFRLNTKTADGHSPLLVRLSSHTEQSALLAAFRANKGLSLQQLENISQVPDASTSSASRTRIYINESLTQENSSILRFALRLRREGLLFSARTRNGLVYVRKSKDDTETKILSTTKLS